MSHRLSNCLKKDFLLSKIYFLISYSGCGLIGELYSHKKAPSTAFTIKILNSLQNADMFDEFREIVHRNVESLEIWGYYIEYCVKTQRIDEILFSINFYKSNSKNGSYTVSLFNKLAAEQIRFTIFQNS